MKVITIDCDYVAPGFAAAFLVTDGDEALFVENNTAHSVPRLLAALAKEGMSPEQVRYLIVTHIHLDHAGGTHALLRACPHATVLAHPRAAPHLIDPSKLITSARQVYGDERFKKLYGEIGPIAAARVRSMADEEELQWKDCSLRFLHTRGHANHHFCIRLASPQNDPIIFTGDSFGLAYPALQKHGLFVFPSTSPTDFDPDEALRSFERVLGSGAKIAYLTHFGGISDLLGAKNSLNEYIQNFWPKFREMSESPQGDRSAADLTTECRRLISEYLEAEYEKLGGKIDDAFRAILKMDIDLNAAGMVFAAQKSREKQRKQPKL